MLRGEIRLVDLNPVCGREASKRRPAVNVSGDRANSIATRLGRGVVTVVPVTTSIGLQGPGRAVRSITVERLGAVLGRPPADVMAQLDDALRLHLQL